MRDQALIAWLCFIYENIPPGRPICIPVVVDDALRGRGWLVSGDGDWRGSGIHITEAGQAMVDLYGPEYGVTSRELAEE